MPGGGSIMKMLEAASGKKPIIIGKPSKILFDTIIEEHKLEDVPLDEFIMIGDKLDTDIKFGENIGIDTMLVLTGVTTKSNYSETKDDPTKPVPTYVSERLPEVNLE
mmetsp:Transcript_19490/g.19163  ORF Transcript_19490/g.19163 Transcript_19490/m.19163 type:complete len:107 (-) Transcript_19490:19-339(-)